MAADKREFENGIRLRPSSAALTIIGDLGLESTTGDLKYYDGSASRTVVNLSGTQSLTNKTIDASQNTITNITESMLGSATSIPYSKLNLSSSITNSDVAAAASISYSKLNLSSSVVNSDIAAAASISGSKINPDFSSQPVTTSGGFRVSGGSSSYVAVKAGSATSTYDLILPTSAGTNGQILRVTSTASGVQLGFGDEASVVSVAITATTTISTNNTEGDITGASINLTAGTWQFCWGSTISLYNGDATTQAVSLRVRVTDSSNTAVTSTAVFAQYSVASSVTTYPHFSLVSPPVVVASSATYKLRMIGFWGTTGSVSFRGADLGVFTGSDNEAFFFARKVT